MWEVIFWTCILTVVYHYVGYPLTLMLLSRMRRPAALQTSETLPTVSLIISVYNEEAVIRSKIENALALDYPVDKLEIVVASDGSTDQTCEIVREFKSRGVTLYHQDDRRGKNGALNGAASRVTGDVLVFTDANGMFQPNAIRELIRPFADPRVGSVCGELIYQNPNQNLVAEGYNHYWRYDQWLKTLESRLHSLLGANGSLFAVRRELNEWLDPRISNDMVLPIKIANRGQKVAFVSVDGDFIPTEGYVTFKATEIFDSKDGSCTVTTTACPELATWAILQDVGSGFFGTEIPMPTANIDSTTGAVSGGPGALGLIAQDNTVIARFDVNPSFDMDTDIFVWLNSNGTLVAGGNFVRNVSGYLQCEDELQISTTIPLPFEVNVIDPSTLGGIGQCTQAGQFRGVLRFVMPDNGFLWSHIAQEGQNFRENFLGYNLD